ncbi:MAG TPA: S8 family serine peptidase [Pedococcus sp.]|nr:S8 family serine peptidase [Pedococcus sp.]
MSQFLRHLFTGSAVALVALAPALSDTAAAAPAPAPGPGATRPHASGSHGSGPRAAGKGDRDGDKLTDDLEAALAGRTPSDRVRVIVQGATPADARRAEPSLTVDHTYTLVRAFSGSVAAGRVAALAALSRVTRVELDGVATAADIAGEEGYGVTAARAAYSGGDGTLDGNGVGICVIDTGIDPNHEQLGGRVVGWRDWVNGRTAPYDDHGHGTHVSSIAAGDGTGSVVAGQYGGVARAASLIGAKVLNSSGSGSDADVAAAIEWCAGRSDVRVISMSLGSPGGDGSDIGSQMANAAAAAGKVVVVAAGNSGDAPGTITAPGVATDVITVGAASDESTVAGGLDTDVGLYLAGFSGRGPTANPAARLKPDVVAPGLSVVAAKANAPTSYVAYSGTSMATPFVAGVVALGLEAAPGSSPAAIKSALQTTARDAGAAGADNEWGHGLVDARAFLAALGGAAAGASAWPGHQLVEGSVGSAATRDIAIEVRTAGRPLAVTLQTTNGAATCALPVGDACWGGYEWAPDLDAYLVNPTGTVVAVSRCMLEASNGNCAAPGRFESLSISSAAAGTWTLRVESFSGSGTFRADVFGGLDGSSPPEPPPAAPSAPAGLTGTALSKSQVRLAWTDTSGNESGFRVERCRGGSCTTFATVASLSAGSTAYTDSGLRAGVTYRYRVLAWNDAGVSGYSNIATVKTPRR